MRFRALYIPLSLLLATGCASSGDLKDLQQQVTDLQDQIADLRRQVSSKEEVQQLNEKIGQQTQQTLRSNADLSVKVSELDDRLQNAQGGIEQTNYRIDRLVQQVTQNQRDLDALKTGAPAPAAGAAGPGGAEIRDEVMVQPPLATSVDPIEVYQTAYRDYQRGSYDLAIEGFEDFLGRNAGSDLADNAAYWIGESLYSQKKYTQAIEQFDKVVNQYPKSDKVPGALLKKGYSYIEIGQKAQGVVQLQYVIHEHPKSQEASLARQKLRSLGIESK